MTSPSKTIRVVERDIELLSVVGRFRFMSAQHLGALLFPSEKAAGERCRALLGAKLLVEVFVPVRPYSRSSRTVYALSARGARLVADERAERHHHLSESERRSGLFLDHTLARNTLYVVLELLHRAGTLQLLSWRHAPDEVGMSAKIIEDGLARRIPLVPDAVVVVRADGRDELLVVEIDMGTVAPVRMARKYAAYWKAWRLGTLARLAPAPVRVLTLTTTPSRLARLRLASRAAAEGDRTTRLFWFALLDGLDLAHPDQVLTAICSTSDTNDKHLLPIFTSSTSVCPPGHGVPAPLGSNDDPSSAAVVATA